MQGDSLVYQVQKQIKELGDKVPAETVSKVEEKVKELEEALKGEDTDKIKVRPVVADLAVETLTCHSAAACFTCALLPCCVQRSAACVMQRM